MYNNRQTSSHQFSLQHPQLQQQNLNRLRYVRLVTSMLNNSYNGSSSASGGGSRLGGGSNSVCGTQSQVFVPPRIFSIASPLGSNKNNNISNSHNNISNSSILMPLNNSFSETHVFVSFIFIFIFLIYSFIIPT